jgi:hypothetical protein
MQQSDLVSPRWTQVDPFVQVPLDGTMGILQQHMGGNRCDVTCVLLLDALLSFSCITTPNQQKSKRILHINKATLQSTTVNNNNNNNITACPPMVSIPHQWLCLLWSKPRKNYEL